MSRRKVSSIKYVRRMFRKTNISNPLLHTRTCAYQGVRNVNFSDDPKNDQSAKLPKCYHQWHEALCSAPAEEKTRQGYIPCRY